MKDMGEEYDLHIKTGTYILGCQNGLSPFALENQIYESSQLTLINPITSKLRMEMAA